MWLSFTLYIIMYSGFTLIGYKVDAMIEYTFKIKPNLYMEVNILETSYFTILIYFRNLRQATRGVILIAVFILLIILI